MPCRKSRGGSRGNDWSPYEVAWVNILHREIFEDGTYFDKVNSTKHVKSVKYEDSSDEDEGFSDYQSTPPYVKMVQISSKSYLSQLSE